MNLPEERFFFESEGARCYAVLHHPAAESADRAARPGVVLCHPLLDFDLYEVPWTIRLVTGYTRELAQAGYPRCALTSGAPARATASSRT